MRRLEDIIAWKIVSDEGGNEVPRYQKLPPQGSQYWEKHGSYVPFRILGPNTLKPQVITRMKGMFFIEILKLDFTDE